MKRFIILGLLTTIFCAARQSNDDVTRFEGEYLNIKIPKGKCAGVKLTVKPEMQRKDLVVQVIAVNVGAKSASMNRSVRGLLELYDNPVIYARADDASDYHLFVHRLDQRTRKPIESIHANEVFEKPEVIIRDCTDDIIMNGQRVEFGPMNMSGR